MSTVALWCEFGHCHINQDSPYEPFQLLECDSSVTRNRLRGKSLGHCRASLSEFHATKVQSAALVARFMTARVSTCTRKSSRFKPRRFPSIPVDNTPEYYRRQERIFAQWLVLSTYFGRPFLAKKRSSAHYE